MPEYVIAVEWKNSGVRTFITLPHGGWPSYTYSLASAGRITYKNVSLAPKFLERITSWRVMTLPEAEYWLALWPWTGPEDDKKIMPGDIPYWPMPTPKECANCHSSIAGMLTDLDWDSAGVAFPICPLCGVLLRAQKLGDDYLITVSDGYSGQYGGTY